MATPTYDFIASVTTTSVVNQVSFLNIAQDYQDLFIVCDVEANAFDSWLGLRLNTFNANNDYQYMGFGNGTNSSYSSTSATQMQIYSHIQTTKGIYRINIFDYASTSKTKSILAAGGNSNSGGFRTSMNVGLYDKSLAVDNVYLFGGQGLDIAVGSKFSLYGIVG